MVKYYLVILGIVGLIPCVILAYNLYKKIMYWLREIELNQFKKFIKNTVIPTFNEQRQGEGDDRFAVLMLASKANLWGLSKMSFKRVHTSFFNNPLVNHSFPSFPLENEVKNYIVARADHEEKHPESIVLERFDELKTAYQEHCDKKVNTALLYSWKLPCARCVDEILEMFANRYMYVVIAYSKDSNASAVNKLRSHRLNVIEVPYNRFPRNSNKCCIQ